MHLSSEPMMNPVRSCQTESNSFYFINLFRAFLLIYKHYFLEVYNFTRSQTKKSNEQKTAQKQNVFKNIQFPEALCQMLNSFSLFYSESLFHRIGGDTVF